MQEACLGGGWLRAAYQAPPTVPSFGFSFLTSRIVLPNIGKEVKAIAWLIGSLPRTVNVSCSLTHFYLWSTPISYQIQVESETYVLLSFIERHWYYVDKLDKNLTNRSTLQFIRQRKLSLDDYRNEIYPLFLIFIEYDEIARTCNFTRSSKRQR